jgi:putative SOS response-associated peptidase YedK
MCSRYAFVPDAPAWADYRSVFGALADELLAHPARPRLAPTDAVPVVVQQPGGVAPQVVQARWGFIPHWWNKPETPRLAFNARSEEAATKPMWRDALRRTRCLIPATHWYEWQKSQGGKIPHSLTPGDGRGFMFAGLWSLWRPRPQAEAAATCVILTMDASPHVAHVHERMPVVLAPQAWMRWLDPGLTDSAAALALLREHAVRAVVAVAIDAA